VHVLDQRQAADARADIDAGIVPFLDLAYQGFADGADADAYAPRLLAICQRPTSQLPNGHCARRCPSTCEV